MTATGASDVGALGWRRLALWAAIVTIVVIVITAFVAEIILLLISAVLLGVGAALTRRSKKAGLMVLAVVSVLLLLTNGPFVVPYLVAPESWTNFILVSVLLLGSLVTAVASIAAIRTRGAVASAPRTVAQVAIALAVVLVGVGVAAGITYSAPSAARGDVRLTAENIRFSRANINASAGSVSVFVTNHDTVLHTFTIDQLNVNPNVPANSTARVAFQASPGRYRYVCTLHPTCTASSRWTDGSGKHVAQVGCRS